MEDVLVVELQIVFQDLLFQPSEASFYTTFLKNCGIGLGTATCPKTVVGGNQADATCNVLWLAVIKGMLPVMYCGWG